MRRAARARRSGKEQRPAPSIVQQIHIQRPLKALECSAGCQVESIEYASAASGSGVRGHGAVGEPMGENDAG